MRSVRSARSLRVVMVVDIYRDTNKPSVTQECHAVTHTCFMTHGKMTDHVAEDFLAIVDTACTKSVAGYSWFEQFYKMSDALHLPF